MPSYTQYTQLEVASIVYMLSNVKINKRLAAEADANQCVLEYIEINSDHLKLLPYSDFDQHSKLRIIHWYLRKQLLSF